ncbi:MAG: amidohydrolase family protein [Armatimonadetes bacterium]|nr:amidohydrolase family protein [Armatimonadota bacterium]
MTTQTPMIDCHVHLSGLEGIPRLEGLRTHVGLDRMNLVCTMGRNHVNANPAAFVAKAERPDRFYVFAGLDHTAFFSANGRRSSANGRRSSAGEVAAPSLAEQVDRLRALGADGIKMIENKPTARKLLDVPVDSDYFADYFARVEETGFPVLWHVNDPEEFWIPELTPSWARERGWGYDETFVAKEQLYAEVENVLARHPKLKLLFAHFYFLSADLPRAARLFDRFENVHLDLAPGVELLYNLSQDVEATREFFTKYADRIVFGTDTASGNSPQEAQIRAGLVTRWLETDDEYLVPDEADFLLGPPEDGLMRGLSLPADVLARIYRGNFERLAGSRPILLDRSLAAEECDRIAAEIDALAGRRLEDNHARAAALRLRG